MRARTVLIALGAVGVLGLGALALAASSPVASPAPDPDPAPDPREGEGDQPGAVVVIDPGHGGNGMVGGSSANNARGPGGTLEKDLTLDVSRRQRAYLVAHGMPAGQVLLTQDSDKNRGLSERLLFALQAGAAVFLSIHFNGFNDPGVQGGEVWIAQNASPASVALASRLSAALHRATGYRSRGVKRKNLEVLYGFFHDPQIAAALVEVSFLTDPAEEERLRSEGYRDQIAARLGDAVLGYLQSGRSAA